MAVVHSVGSVAITGGSTSNISPTLTWSDAGSHTPQWAFYLIHEGAVGTVTGAQKIGWGLSDGTRQYAVAQHLNDGDPSSTGRYARVTNSGCVLLCDSAGAEDGRADISSFGSNTFTLAVSNAFAANSTLFYVCGAGYDNAELLLGQRDTTTATNYDRTLAVGGFTPTACIAMHASDLVSLDTAGAGANISLGWATGASNQAMITNFGREAQTVNYTWGCVSTSYLLGGLATDEGLLLRTTRLVSFGANKLTLINDGGITAARFGILCLKGGTPLATTTTANTSTGTFNVSTTGVTPDCAIGIANYPAIASQAAGTEPQHWGIGALDHGGNQWAVNAFEPNNETLGGAVVTETYIRSATDRFMVHWDDTGADTIAVTGDIIRSAESANTLTLNQNDADTALVLIPILVLGNPPAGGTSRSVFTTNARRYSN